MPPAELAARARFSAKAETHMGKLYHEFFANS